MRIWENAFHCNVLSCICSDFPSCKHSLLISFHFSHIQDYIFNDLVFQILAAAFSRRLEMSYFSPHPFVCIRALSNKPCFNQT